MGVDNDDDEAQHNSLANAHIIEMEYDDEDDVDEDGYKTILHVY